MTQQLECFGRRSEKYLCNYRVDNPILKEIKNLQKKDGRSIGKIVSQLLAEALDQHNTTVKAHRLKWASRPMGALLDLSDKDTLYKFLDKSEH